MVVMERNNNKIVADYLVSKSEMSIDDMGWYVDSETNVPYLNPPFDRSWDMLIHAWHIFATEQWNDGVDISYTEADFNDCVVRNAPKTAAEILANAILNRYIVKSVNKKIKCIDKFDNELADGDLVDVQQAGQHRIYKRDGLLYFRPYGEEEKVSDYFSNDIIKVTE